jgi:hypothetical protein
VIEKVAGLICLGLHRVMMIQLMCYMLLAFIIHIANSFTIFPISNTNCKSSTANNIIFICNQQLQYNQHLQYNNARRTEDGCQLSVANREISEIESEEDVTEQDSDNNMVDYSSMTTLPRHPTNTESNEILGATQKALRSMQEELMLLDDGDYCEEIPLEIEQESVYANSYVDLGKVDTVGFDYDYTLVTYTKQLLKLIYDMALNRLVEEKEYPREMLDCGLRFDPFFCIRGKILY